MNQFTIVDSSSSSGSSLISTAVANGLTISKIFDETAIKSPFAKPISFKGAFAVVNGRATSRRLDEKKIDSPLGAVAKLSVPEKSMILSQFVGTAMPPPLPPRAHTRASSAFKLWLQFPDRRGSSRSSGPIIQMTEKLFENYVAGKGARKSEERIRRWQITAQKIGKGAFATVYIGNDLQRNCKIAIKVNHNDLECYAVAKKEHQNLYYWHSIPHIIRYYGGGPFGLQDNTSLRTERVVVTEFVPCVNLAEQFRLNPWLPFIDILVIFRQLLEMHIAASDRGWVHADLKPGNLIYYKGKLTVLDLGLAHSVSAPKEENSIQTIDYRSPEVILGKNYDTSIDLWSIGTIIYQVFSGKYFVRSNDDDDYNQLDALHQIACQIGLAPSSFLNQCKFGHCYFSSCKYKPRPLIEQIRNEAAKKGLSIEISERFARVLAEILKYEDRINPELALKVCNEISSLYTGRDSKLGR